MAEVIRCHYCDCVTIYSIFCLEMDTLVRPSPTLYEFWRSKLSWITGHIGVHMARNCGWPLGTKSCFQKWTEALSSAATRKSIPPKPKGTWKCIFPQPSLYGDYSHRQNLNCRLVKPWRSEPAKLYPDFQPTEIIK